MKLNRKKDYAMNNNNELTLIYEEKFETDLALGDWHKVEHPYKEMWRPLEGKGSARNPEATRDCYLTAENAMVKDGQLILLATEQEKGYCGVELRTKEFYNYGYFEIEAKVNSSKGICPAFWLVGSRDSASHIEYEIDVFECFGGTPDIIKATPLAHCYPNGSQNPKTETAHKFECYERLCKEPTPIEPHNSFLKGNWGDEFHKYAVDWKPGSITWLIDDEPWYRVDTAHSLEGKFPFNEPLKVILTTYSGVDVCRPRTGLPDETTDWENGCSMTINAIRIYEYQL